MKAVIYTRPVDTAAIKETPTRQHEICSEYAKAQGYDIVDHYTDSSVGHAPYDRPGLWTALNAMPHETRLIVYHRDVISHLDYPVIVITIAVEKQRNGIEAVTGGMAGYGSAEARLVHRVLATVAEHEQKCARARKRHAFLHNREEGIRAGRYAPYGWKLDTALGETKNNKAPKQMIRNVEEEPAIREIIRRRVEEAQGYYDIATALNGSVEFQPIARHGKWNAKAIRKICERFGCSAG